MKNESTESIYFGTFLLLSPEHTVSFHFNSHSCKLKRRDTVLTHLCRLYQTIALFRCTRSTAINSALRRGCWPVPASLTVLLAQLGIIRLLSVKFLPGILRPLREDVTCGAVAHQGGAGWLGGGGRARRALFSPTVLLAGVVVILTGRRVVDRRGGDEHRDGAAAAEAVSRLEPPRPWWGGTGGLASHRGG